MAESISHNAGRKMLRARTCRKTRREQATVFTLLIELHSYSPVCENLEDCPQKIFKPLRAPQLMIGAVKRYARVRVVTGGAKGDSKLLYACDRIVHVVYGRRRRPPSVPLTTAYAKL